MTVPFCFLLLVGSMLGVALHAQAPAPRTPPDRFAGLRRVNLADSGAIWIGFGGQLRERVEHWTGFNFGALPPAPATARSSDLFALTRLVFSADLHAGRHFRLFAQGKSAFSTRRALAGGRRPSDVDEIDAHQLHAEWRSAPLGGTGGVLRARAGRFEMAYGRERLVSALDWANTKRSFDGVSAGYAAGTSDVTAFRARPVIVRPYEPDRRDSTTTLFGVYATTPLPRVGGADVYWLGQRRDSGAVAWNGTVGREHRHTGGVRLWSVPSAASAFDLEGEAAFQFGRMGSERIRAFMLAGQAGYTLRHSSRRPRVYVSVDYASGDESPGGEVGTFSQLNPQPHPFLGLADIAGRQNIVDVSGGTTIRAWRAMLAGADYHVLRRASAADAFYALPGGVARPSAFGSAKVIATELDLTLRWPVDRHLLLHGGWSRVFPGAYIRQGGGASGADRPIGFTYLMLQYTL